MPKEVWVIKGRRPVIWSVPFWAQPLGEKMQICPAVLLNPKQKRAVNLKLKEYHAWPDVRGIYTLEGGVLETIGELTAGGDAEEYFVWAPRRDDQMSPGQRHRRADLDAFLDSLYTKGIGSSRTEVEHWWATFCNHMADWLINQQKPVDLHFVKLHLSPYRRNWMQTLLARFPRLGRAVCGQSEGKRRAILEQAQFTDQMMSLDLLAMSKEGYCYQYVEVEHQLRWWRAIRKSEKGRLSKRGGFVYAKNFMDSVGRRIGRGIQCYVSWLTHIARPTAVNVEGGLAGEFRFAPHVAYRANEPRPYRTHFVPVVVPNKLEYEEATSDPAALSGAPPKLPLLPHIRKSPPHLRSGGGNLFRPKKPANGAARVLVPDGGEGGAAGGLLGMEAPPGMGLDI